MSVNASIVFCDSIQSSIINGKLSPTISRPLSYITPISIPSNYTFAIYCSLEGLERDKKHVLRIEVKDPDNLLIMSATNLELPSIEDINSKVYPRVEISIDMRNVVIMHAGTFKAEIYDNDDSICVEELQVLVPN